MGQMPLFHPRSFFSRFHEEQRVGTLCRLTVYVVNELTNDSDTGIGVHKVERKLLFPRDIPFLGNKLVPTDESYDRLQKYSLVLLAQEVGL